MSSTVGIRPNHYQVLGLTPSASDGEIARAFADAMSMFRVRPVAVLAEISAAYETLRNPAKRREYDRSIGIAQPPAPRQWAIAAPAVRWGPLTGVPAFAPPAASVEPAQAAPAASRPVEPTPELDALSAIAASLREIARPDALDAPVQWKRSEPLPGSVESALPHFLAESRFDPEEPAEERAFEWKRPALAVGGFVVAAGLIGTVAGLSVKDSAQSFGSQPSIIAALPPAKAHAKAPSAEVARTDDAEAPAAVGPALRPRRAPSHRQPSSWVEHSVREAQAVESASADGTADEAAADPLAPAAPASAPEPQAVAASMPLPSGTVARTIERIGYSCGKVASTAAVDGSPGVFTVTCTSGQSYQASPVHGHYRFRKLGGR